MSEQNKKVALTMQEVSSCECFEIEKDNSFVYEPVLKNITLRANANECMGFSGDNIFAVELLCKIAGNMRPYESGKCVLNEIGMMRQKRIALEHLFFIDSASALYEHMTVLEYIMFSTLQRKEYSTVERQSFLLELLVKLGMGEICLTLIAALTTAEKALVYLVVALMSKSSIIIFDVLNIEFTNEEIAILNKLCHYAKSHQKTVIIGTMQPKLIGVCCDRVAVLRKGQVYYEGNIKDLILQSDRVKYVIHHSNINAMKQRLEKVFSEYEIEIRSDMILLLRKENVVYNRRSFFIKLAENNIYPDQIKINRGRVGNSFEELMANDLSQ